MKIKEVPIGKRFLAKIMLGANVWVHAEYVKGKACPNQPGRFDCNLTAIEIVEHGFVTTQKPIKDEAVLAMLGEAEVYHEET